MKILLLSAYDASSHRRWHRGLVEHFPEHTWTVLTLPPRFFSWRIRSNSLSWAFSEREVLQADYDLLIATSMTDLSALRGMCPSLGLLPTLVYFHENQFAYPIQEVYKRDAYHFRMLNLYTALCADTIVFNSHFNRDTFLEGVQLLLKRAPDAVPPEVATKLRQHSTVASVPLEATCYPQVLLPREGALQILWNHRWEYDKAPERFFQALYQLHDAGVDFHLHVVGQQFRRSPTIFEEAKQRLASHIKTWGFVAERSDYNALLQRCDLVLSTALHEFQGLAVQEALAAGCDALTPDRLAYQEYVPDDFRYASYPEDATREAAAIAEKLQQLIQDLDALRVRQQSHLPLLSWEHQKQRYAALFAATVEGALPPTTEKLR